MKRALEYKYPNEDFSAVIAELALQQIIFDYKKDAPFPGPVKSEFTFIDLFAGIGGFRIALQNLGGKCVFTSEWDVQAKKTYEVNFGEVPFGDITKDETKNLFLMDLMFYVQASLSSIFNCRLSERFCRYKRNFIF